MIQSFRVGLCLIAVICGLNAAAAPPLSIEIAPEHPLFIFQAPGVDAEDGMAQAGEIVDAWFALSDALRPYAVMNVESRHIDIELRAQRYGVLLKELQQVSLPVAIHVAGPDPASLYPVSALEELIAAYSTVKGVYVTGLSFNQFPPYGDNPAAIPVEAQWLAEVIDLAASYGRFVAVSLDELHWLRIETNPVYQPLFQKIRVYKSHVIPLNLHRGPHNIARTASLMGLWLSDTVDQWGVALTSQWYDDANFVAPGVFGPSQTQARMPPELYRAMVLTGVMTGASVYAFDETEDLWTGTRKFQWDQDIRGVLEETVERGLIPRRDIVRNKIRVAYQLNIAETPSRFRENIDDIDVVYGNGAMLRGAYGIEHAGQMPELIPNTGRFYWIPVLPPFTPAELLENFNVIIRPGDVEDAAAWRQLLEFQYSADGEGEAFITRVGRGFFVMHTLENLYREQRYHLPNLPAAVRGLKVERKAGGVLLNWPFREGDFSYAVYRRVLPETRFSVLAASIDNRRFLDTSAGKDDTVAYAVSALTNDREPHAGTVNFGDYLVFSSVASRLNEEVIVYPQTQVATATLVRNGVSGRPSTQSWWPNTDNLSSRERELAQNIAVKIESLETGFQLESVDAVMNSYAKAYKDVDGAGGAYVRQVYETFFRTYDACRMHRQIRRWDFSTYPSNGEVSVLLYCKFTGVALTDRTGRFADIPESFPDTPTGEVWITFSQEEGPWRIVHTNPPLPRLADIVTAP